MKAKDILEKRAKLIHDAREVYDRSETEGREATAEENKQFDDIMAASDILGDDAKRATQLEVAELDLGEPHGRMGRIPDGSQGRDFSGFKIIELRKSIIGETRDIKVPTGPEAEQRMADYSMYLRSGKAPEGRALSKDIDIEGGFLSPPIEFMAELIKQIDDLVHMRRISRVLPPLMEATTLGAPQIDTDMTDPTWTSEIDIGAEDTTFDFVRRELTPNALAKFIKVSKKLLRISTMSADAIVRDRLAVAFGRATENAYLNGTGSGEPLGVFTNDANGIDTDRNVSEDNTTTAFTFDGLINAQMFVRAQYRSNAQWMMHRDSVKRMRKLKDDDGRYIFIPAIIPGVPDTLLGDPLNESEFAPNTFTTGLNVAVYGDFRHYWIVDALTLTIQVLVELFAATNQNGYLGRLESDAAPVDSLAFSRVTLA